MTLKNPEDKGWEISLSLYPGILFGMRTYEEEYFSTHVLYLPFIELVLEIDK